MKSSARNSVALALAGAMMLAALPAHSQHQFSGNYVKVTITECWSIPFTSMSVCRTRDVWVAEHLLDEVLSGEINP
jgi:hypothetical protein